MIYNMIIILLITCIE